MTKKWFKRKKIGWGWVPATWQGWLMILVYITSVLVLISTSLIGNLFYLSIILIILTILILFLSYWFGEEPKWQWGNNSKKENK